ncbi:MAG TPA: hypothetical protein VNB49_18015 [Candidatus Dormibacteraeota bacterium]|nr:hypothetical protein [Candidatus Dormibacteraeota bacterium]
MEYLIGAGLAVVVCAFAGLVGFDRGRVFYPTLLTVIATYYILFAVIGSSTPALALESLIAAAFLATAVVGFKKNLCLIVAALGGHEGHVQRRAYPSILRRTSPQRRHPLQPAFNRCLRG